jgi:hypothetical protein
LEGVGLNGTYQVSASVDNVNLLSESVSTSKNAEMFIRHYEEGYSYQSTEN